VQGDVPGTRPRPRILIVEDELLIAMEIEQMLVELGCAVVGPAPSVAQALAILDREEPDFAILDVNLGPERSTPIAEALRKRGVPFALATGYDRSQLPEPAYRHALHLGKPLDHKRLVDARVGSFSRLSPRDAPPPPAPRDRHESGHGGRLWRDGARGGALLAQNFRHLGARHVGLGMSFD
jgi:CheY-like chemotaxis protein